MQLLAFLFSLFIDDAHAAAFNRTIPDPADRLTIQAAREHIASAFAVGLVTRTRPARLLSIAYFESRYRANVVSTEEAGKVSCGVMTPEPTASCQPTDLVSNYLAGALHLRRWLDTYPHDDRRAMLGYGGGFRAIKRCAVEPGHPKCTMPETRNARERMIERAWRQASQVLRWGA